MKMANRKADIKKEVTHRQSMKKKWDRFCKYSTDEEFQEAVEAGAIQHFTSAVELKSDEKSEENWVRLLDEGVVVDGGDWVWAVLQKGVIKRFYDELPENFEGYIDKDHIRALYLGKYTKDDLRLVELGDDRYALEVNLKLDKSLYAVQDLLKQGEHRALSVEMRMKADEYAKVSKVTGMSEKEVDAKFGWDYLVPIVSDIGVQGFAVVESPKNANSFKDDMLENASVSEGEDMSKEDKEKLAKLAAEAEAEKKTDEAEKADLGSEDGADEKAPENKSEEAQASATEEDKKEDLSAEDYDETVTVFSAEQYQKVEEAIKSLKADNEAKDAKIAELEAALAEKKESEKSVKMSAEDRVAALLNLAVAAEPKAGEGAGHTTSNLSKAEEIEAFYREAFEDDKNTK